MSYYFDGEGPVEYDESPCDSCRDLPTCPAAYNLESYECALIPGPPAELEPITRSVHCSTVDDKPAVSMWKQARHTGEVIHHEIYVHVTEASFRRLVRYITAQKWAITLGARCVSWTAEETN